MAGRLDCRSYCLLLRSLEPIYRELERGLVRNVAMPAVRPVVFPALFRTAALHQDLGALHGPLWEAEISAMPASRLYAEELAGIARSSPELLVSHAYVRYLGDIYGGQILQGVVRRSLRLSATDAGTAFYDFGSHSQLTSLAQTLREGLDAIGAGETQANDLVAEAQRSFFIHCALFDDLARALALPVDA